MVHRSSAVAIVPFLAQLAVAEQKYSISTTAFTTCGPVPTPAPPTTGENGIVTVIMPACPDCTCACAHTKTYNTVYETVCPTGVTEVTYTVAEVYKGISTAPAIVNTVIPHGFTTTVVTCNTCGPAAITKTLTVPVTQPTGNPGAPGPGGQQPVSPGPSGQQPGSPAPAGQQPGGAGCSGGSGSGCGAANNGTNPVAPVVGGSSKLQSCGGLLIAAAAAAIL